MEPTFSPSPERKPEDQDALSAEVSQPISPSADPANQTATPLPVADTNTVQPLQPAQQSPMPWDKPQVSTGQENVFADSSPNSTSQAAPVFGSSPASIMQPAVPSKGRKKLVVITGIVVGLLLLGGGAAAAYFGVVVPNNPENVLRQALVNTTKENEMSFDGKLEAKAADTTKTDAIPAIKAEFNSKVNTTQKQSEITLTVTASGIDFPLNARYVDGDIYVKVGDLNTIMALVGSNAASALGFNAAEIDPLLKNVSKLVSNQWVEFDSTLLDQAGASCVVDAGFTLTDQDIKLLEDQFMKNPFAKIASHSDDTVGGKSAIKYEISIDDNKGAKYIQDSKLQDLSFMKALKKCPSEWSDTLGYVAGDSTELADGDITPLTLWVDKDTKRIAKIASHSTKQDAEKGNLSATFEATIGYGTVSVTKPENAKPAMQLWGELQKEFTQFFGMPSDMIIPLLEYRADSSSFTSDEYLTQ